VNGGELNTLMRCNFIDVLVIGICTYVES